MIIPCYNLIDERCKRMEFDLNKKHCYYFKQISDIPRGSRNEKAVSDYIVAFAKDHEVGS